MGAVVFGASEVSFFLVRRLVYEHEVTVVAMEGQNVGKFEDLGASVVFVSSVDPKSISELGIQEGDVCVSMFEEDELNITVSQLVGEIFGVKTRVAKVKNERYLEEKGFLRPKKDGFLALTGNTISLEEEVANSLIDNLEVAKGMDFNCVMNAGFVLTGINVPSRIENLVNKLKSLGCSVLGALRDSGFVSESNLDEALPGDTLYLVIKRAEVNNIMGEIFGLYFKMGNKNAVVIGGGSLGFAIARKLRERGVFKHVKIIEKSLEVATDLFERAEDIEIINGNILDQGIINDANIQEADLVISATEDDSVNVISSHMCKKLGCKYMVSILRENAFVGILRSFGADLIVNSFDIFTSKVVNLIRGDPDIKTSFFADGRNVLVEMSAQKGSGLVGVKVGDLESKRNVTVAVVKGKDGAIHPPAQSYKICLNDNLLVSMPHSRISQMKKIFSSKAVLLAVVFGGILNVCV